MGRYQGEKGLEQGKGGKKMRCQALGPGIGRKLGDGSGWGRGWRLRKEDERGEVEGVFGRTGWIE